MRQVQLEDSISGYCGSYKGVFMHDVRQGSVQGTPHRGKTLLPRVPVQHRQRQLEAVGDGFRSYARCKEAKDAV